MNMSRMSWLMMLCLLFSPAQEVRVKTISQASSVSSAGGGTGDSGGGLISQNNQWVVFCSAADDLVTNDFNQAPDVFAWNVANKKIVLVSIDKSGKESANGISSLPSVSSDGRYVSFLSLATNLVENDGNNRPDIFVRDLVEGKTSLVTANAAGTASSTITPFDPRLSSNGRWVVFRPGGTAASRFRGICFCEIYRSPGLSSLLQICPRQHLQRTGCSKSTSRN